MAPQGPLLEGRSQEYLKVRLGKDHGAHIRPSATSRGSGEGPLALEQRGAHRPARRPPVKPLARGFGADRPGHIPPSSQTRSLPSGPEPNATSMRAAKLGVALRVLARGTRGHAASATRRYSAPLSSRCQPACWATARLMVPLPNRSGRRW